MTLADANSIIKFLETVKTEKYKHLSICKDLYCRRLGSDATYSKICYGVRITDLHDDIIDEFYSCTHYSYRRMRYIVRTNEHLDYEAMHRESEF